MSPVNSNAHQVSLQRAMDCLAAGDEEEALNVLNVLEESHGLRDTSRFLRAQVFLALSRRQSRSRAGRLLKRAAKDALRIKAEDADGIIRQMRRALAQSLCEHAVRSAKPASVHGTPTGKTLRRLHRNALPLILLARELAADDPNVVACQELVQRMIGCYQALEKLSECENDAESMHCE